MCGALLVHESAESANGTSGSSRGRHRGQKPILLPREEGQSGADLCMGGASAPQGGACRVQGAYPTKT